MGVNIQKYDLRIVKESGNRYEFENKYVKTPEKAHQVFIKILELDKRSEEVFAMLTIDVKSKLTGVFTVSIGNLTSSLVKPREVFKRAILQNSAAIILAHNHPSGNPQPSQDDIKLTKNLMEAGEIVDIEIIDHLIIGDGNYFISMKEKELI